MTQPIHYQRYEPAQELRKDVHYYWFMENEGPGTQKHPDLLIPDGYPEAIFILAGSYCKRMLADESQMTIVSTSSVIGIQHTSILVKRLGKVKLFGIKFKPLGFYRFFGKKGVGTVGKTLSLHTFGSPFLLNLEHSLKTMDTVNGAITMIENILGAQTPVTGHSIPQKSMEECLTRILDTQGCATLDELSRDIQKSKRQIQRYFKEYMGVSPKKFSNLIRFKSIYKKSVLSNSTLAHFFDYGYFDQSHFIKDFKMNLGVTPSNTSTQKFKAQHLIAQKSVGP